jgi:hypothetical protein
MTQTWDFTWFMLRLRRYKKRRVQLEIRIQPGWERWFRDHLREQLAAENCGPSPVARLRYRGLVELRRPGAVLAFLRHIDPPGALLEAAQEYAAACAAQRRARAPDPELALRQERVCARLMALFPRPPARAAVGLSPPAAPPA